MVGCFSFVVLPHGSYYILITLLISVTLPYYARAIVGLVTNFNCVDTHDPNDSSNTHGSKMVRKENKKSEITKDNYINEVD